MSTPPAAEILRFIAASEPLERTLQRFPALDREALEAILLAAARAGPSTEPGPRQRPSVEQPTGVPGRSPPPKSPLPSTGGGKGRGPAKALRIYSDGAARGNPGPAGAGAVLKDSSGEVVERLGRFLGQNTNNFAEYMGLLLGLRRARELGASSVEVFSDSELLVRQLKGHYQVKAPNLRPLFQEASELLRSFEQVRLTHIRRELNQEADEMSNRAIDERLE